jgi:hypothetical protein
MNSSTVPGWESSNPGQQTTDNYTSQDASTSGKKWRRIPCIAAEEEWHLDLAHGFVRLVVFRHKGAWYARAEGKQCIVTEKEPRSLSAAQREAERLGRLMLSRALEDLT